MARKINIVSPADQYQKVKLKAASSSAYLHIAAEIDSQRLPFYFQDSTKKKQLIQIAKGWCKTLESENLAISANVFSAIVIPPGGSNVSAGNKGKIPQARYDFCILVEAVDMKTIEQIHYSEACEKLVDTIKICAKKEIHIIKATNVKRIDDVDHTKQGVFLFNYFLANDLGQNLDVWEYTAGWFQQKTRLDNSTVLLPTPDSESTYKIINHCRWNSIWQILPDLLIRPTFKSFVLKNFHANGVMPMPVLYRLA